MESKSRLRTMLMSHVDRGEVPGLVCLVSRGQDVQVEVAGRMATDGGPIRRDTIFRIASMTKAVTAAAALILEEEGKLRLDDAVDPLLPELADRRVLRRIDGPLDDTVPARRAITLRDLLTFRMGFGIVWGPPDATPIQRAANGLRLGAFGPPEPQVPPPPDEWMRRFGTLPLMHQPGERWMYQTGAEVLGVLIARAAGVPLERFFDARIFEPLGMKDTAFSVPESKIDRFATEYFATDPFRPDQGGYVLRDPARGGQWSRPPAFPSGGGGLVSTVDDYLAFARMLLAGGTAPAGRVLSRDSVRAMTSDQLTSDQKASSEMMPSGYWSHHGWGFGVAVATGARHAGSPGGYGWDGSGTYWCSDPQREMVALLMTQRGAFPAMTSLYREFWDEVYGPA
jgi:CubicO group peptidase (beta-lactamase class C family)